VGGLTVYGALHQHLPRERFVYLGDTARVPYGTKSLSTVERYAVENARFLEARGIKLLVVACNTVSALALPAIRKALKIDVMGVIEPGARAAVQASHESSNKRIGVIATESTVQSGAYTKEISRIGPEALVIERACPLFVPLAEEGWAETDVASAVAQIYLDDFGSHNIQTLVLGCTHYPILKRVIRQTIGEQVRLIDSGEAAAGEIKSLLESRGLARAARQAGAHEHHLCDDQDNFYVTDAADRFARVAERFLGSKLAHLEAVEI